MTLESRANCEDGDRDLLQNAVDAETCAHRCVSCARRAEQHPRAVFPGRGGGFQAGANRPQARRPLGRSLAQRSSSARGMVLSLALSDIPAFSERQSRIPRRSRSTGMATDAILPTPMTP